VSLGKALKREKQRAKQSKAKHLTGKGKAKHLTGLLHIMQQAQIAFSKCKTRERCR